LSPRHRHCQFHSPATHSYAYSQEYCVWIDGARDTSMLSFCKVRINMIYPYRIEKTIFSSCFNGMQFGPVAAQQDERCDRNAEYVEHNHRNLHSHASKNCIELGRLWLEMSARSHSRTNPYTCIESRYFLLAYT
jgi:hypothetical protein